MKTQVPEHDRMKLVKDEADIIASFLEWLEEHYTIATWGEDDDELYPAYVGIEKLLARYLDIDLDKIEAEKMAMLEELRASQ